MESEARKELWAIVQAVGAIYCCVIGTWALFNPPMQTPVQAASSTPGGAPVIPGPHIVWWFWILIAGFIVCALTLATGTVANLVSRRPRQAESQQGTPAWQNLQWANSERERLEGEVKKWKDNYEAATTAPEITEEYRKSVDEQNRLLELGRLIDGVLNPLQIDALRLSTALLDFLIRLGPEPAPKYTAAEIDNMTSARMKELIDANDGDFFEACEYHRAGRLAFNPAQLETQLTTRWTRLLPWYQKVASSYALEFESKVENLAHRFAIEGMSDQVLLLPVQGGHIVDTVQAIAAKLWELAYKIGEKDRHK
jgi:hypothetical protein